MTAGAGPVALAGGCRSTTPARPPGSPATTVNTAAPRRRPATHGPAGPRRSWPRTNPGSATDSRPRPARRAPPPHPRPSTRCSTATAIRTARQTTHARRWPRRIPRASTISPMPPSAASAAAVSGTAIGNRWLRMWSRSRTGSARADSSERNPTAKTTSAASPPHPAMALPRPGSAGPVLALREGRHHLRPQLRPAREPPPAWPAPARAGLRPGRSWRA